MRSRRVISRQDAAKLDLATRIRVEREITDAKAGHFQPHRADAGLDLDTYIRYSPWRKWMFDVLGPLSGKTVVDLGCGYHPTSIYMAAAGASRVYACDISPKAVAHIVGLAEERGLADRVTGIVCAAEQLPLRDGEADLIHGEAVLHHLSLPLAAREVSRVLKRGGKAVFKDPLGQNALLELARDYLKSSAKATDRPLKFEQLDEFGRAFRTCTYRGFGLTSTCASLAGRRKWQRLTKNADALDAFVLRRWPLLERYCQYVVTSVET